LRHATNAQNWVLRGRGGRLLLDLNPAVFFVSSALIIGFAVFGLVFKAAFAERVAEVQATIANGAGWFLVLVVNIILAYAVFLFASRFGRIRIGGADAKPEFSYMAWLAMLFSAGMGIGIMFYGVAEPIDHLISPPLGAEPGSIAAYRDATKVTLLHWGLHAWAIYALTGLALAYFCYNHHAPLSVRSIFAPLLGERVHGWWGHSIDIVSTVATLFGVATSLGLGAMQVNAGLARLTGVSMSVGTQVILIAVITLFATISVVSGLHAGIKRLSVLNVWLAAALLAFVFLIGPTLFVLNGFVQDLGSYISGLVELSFWTETYTGGQWQNQWTVFYWGWWIAWSPFVGLFIARISVGRTIREFIGGALFTASFMTFAWLAVFGNSALFIELHGAGGLIAAVQADINTSLFVFLDLLPGAGGMHLPDVVAGGVAALTIVIIVSFFVTSSDSGSLVIDIITAGGTPEPPVAQRVYWALTEGVVAAVLLAGGGLVALQTAAISVGLPFAVVIVLMIASLHKALANDPALARPP
jgi:choline/glycine/proline betaine transport protein